MAVYGNQWWWEVDYLSDDPARRFVTANELHLPVGRPVHLLLRSRDVVHSFWVPSLSGKVDLFPGRTNELWLKPEAAGVYRGQCAEFCGMQHAKMGLVVVAESPREFAAWAARQRQPARPPRSPVERRGQQVFLSHACAVCHTVAGTPARGTVGPDLTHLGSRLTLAAAVLPNTRGQPGRLDRQPAGDQARQPHAAACR